MTRHFVQVEEAGEKIVLIRGAEDARRVVGETTRGGGPIVGQRGQEIPRLLVSFDDVMLFSVDAAVNGVNESVAPAELRVLEESRSQDLLAGRHEIDVHGVVHAPGHDGLYQGLAGTAAEDVRGAGHKGRLARKLVLLLGERPLAPVDPSVRTEVRAVQIVRAASERLPLEPFLAPVRDSVSVGVGELPYAWRRRHVERAVEPQRAFGKHHPVGKHGPLVEPAVAVRVFKPQDPVRFFLELLFDLVIGPGRLGDVQTPLLVKVGDDGPIHEGRTGGALDLKTGRHGQSHGLVGGLEAGWGEPENQRGRDPCRHNDGEEHMSGFHFSRSLSERASLLLTRKFFALWHKIPLRFFASSRLCGKQYAAFTAKTQRREGRHQKCESNF